MSPGESHPCPYIIGIKLYGLFTMFDNEQATDLRNIVRAANCYGALHEYNYHNHIDTSYSMTFPSGHVADNIRDPPFDYCLFASRTGRNSAVRLNKPDGSFDEKGLNIPFPQTDVHVYNEK